MPTRRMEVPWLDFRFQDQKERKEKVTEYQDKNIYETIQEWMDKGWVNSFCLESNEQGQSHWYVTMRIPEEFPLPNIPRMTFFREPPPRRLTQGEETSLAGRLAHSLADHGIEMNYELFR